MGTNVKVRTHHDKFFDELRKKFVEDQAKFAKAKNVRSSSLREKQLAKAEMARTALKAAEGNNSAAARLLGWSISRFRWVMYGS